MYYRLNVFPINIPPLRERGKDIIVMTKHFISNFSHMEEINIDNSIIPHDIKYPQETISYTSFNDKSMNEIILEVEKNAI